MKEISFNKLDKYMALCKAGGALERVLSLGDDNDKFEVVIKNHISLTQQTELISLVYSEVFKDDVFNAYGYDVILNSSLITYFTNIKIGNTNSDRVMFLIYETDIITTLRENQQVKEICNILNTMIADKKFDIQKRNYFSLRQADRRMGNRKGTDI